MAKYRLIKINELGEELTGGPGKLVPIDVPDLGSPTGYTTKYIQASNLAPPSVDTNIGSDDQTSTDLIRKFILGGGLITDKLSFRNSADTLPIFDIRGDNTAVLPTGYLGVNTPSVGPGFGGHR